MSEPTPVALRPHHDYQSWTSTWYDEQGHRRTKRFGKEHEVSEKVAQRLFRAWYDAEWKAKAFVRNPDDPTTYSVALLCDTWKLVAAKFYVKNDKPTGHVWQVNAAMDALSEMWGALPALDLNNPRVAKLRDAMIIGKKGEPLTVKTVNGRLFCIKQAMKWARENELITAEALADVLAVRPLKVGRCQALPSRKVKPAEEWVIARTREKLPPSVRDMVDVELLTGMRPGEVCNLRAAEINRHWKQGLWLYTPWTHKTEHKECERHVVLGPKSQAILQPYIDANPTGFLFSPALAMSERLSAKAKARKTPLSCGNSPGSNRKRRPMITPGAVWTTGAYRKAIRHACRAVRREMQKADPKATFPNWHPNQLRHNYATLVRKGHGREAVADALGHSGMDLVDTYAEPDLGMVAKLARKVG